MERLLDAIRHSIGPDILLECELPTACLGEECTGACGLTPYGEVRRAHFCAGRRLARRLIARLGGPADAVVGRDRAGCPIWPAGFAGSISHTDNNTVVIVMCTSDTSAVGLDVERVGRISPGLWPSVFTAPEMHTLRRLPFDAPTVLFAAKEAFQKARYALTGAWAELSRLSLRLDWESGSFGHASESTSFGRFVVRDGIALALYRQART